MPISTQAQRVPSIQLLRWTSLPVIICKTPHKIMGCQVHLNIKDHTCQIIPRHIISKSTTDLIQGIQHLTSKTSIETTKCTITIPAHKAAVAHNYTLTKTCTECWDMTLIQVIPKNLKAAFLMKNSITNFSAPIPPSIDPMMIETDLRGEHTLMNLHHGIEWTNSLQHQ